MVRDFPERERAIAAGAHPGGERACAVVGMGVEHGVVADMGGALRIKPGHERAARGAARGHLHVVIFEHARGRGKGIEAGRARVRGAEAAEFVGQVIDGDEEDVGVRDRCGCRDGGRGDAHRRRDEKKNHHVEKRTGG